jgi:hypothetical protein
MTSKGSNGGGLMMKYDEKDAKDLPPTFDWRLYGAVTPVKGSMTLF